jgi:hypothetical protein
MQLVGRLAGHSNRPRLGRMAVVAVAAGLPDLPPAITLNELDDRKLALKWSPEQALTVARLVSLPDAPASARSVSV